MRHYRIKFPVQPPPTPTQKGATLCLLEKPDSNGSASHNVNGNILLISKSYLENT